MKILNYITFIVFMSLPLISAHSQKLKVFDSIPGRPSSEHYLCRVKFESEDDSAWRDAYVLQTAAKAEIGYFDIVQGWTASWITFESDFSGDNVVVEISKKDGSDITEAMVRPAADASPAVILNGKAYVTFSEPANVNVDINGQLENNYTGHGYTGPPVHTISFFANPVFHVPDTNNANVKILKPGEDINALNRTEWDTLVFAPGIHDVGMPFEIHDNEVLFIPGDAVVKGTIHPIDAWGDAASQNFMVYGSGTISGEDILRDPADKSKVYKPFTNQAEGAHLEGFVVADPAFHTFNMNCSRDNTTTPNIYKNLKILAWRVNSDGVNAFRNSEVSGCFFRTQDDAFYLGSSNVNQHDNVVWNDANGAVLFLQGANDGSTCTFRDITVIYHRAQWHWWSGGRIISMRETNPGTTISNVHIQNVLVEDPLPAFPPFYATMIDGTGDITLNNIIIDNVYQAHDGVSTTNDQLNGKPQNTLTGLDIARKWENITFRNCYFNNTWLTSFGDGDFDTAFVDTNTVKFIVTTSPPIADFSSNLTNVNEGETISFTDMSENSPTSWKWVFDGGVPASSTLRNPSVKYQTEGTYNVTLIAINEFGSDTITKNNFVTVIKPVKVYTDTILKVTAPLHVFAGDTISVHVKYETTESRDLRAFIQLNSTPWTNYGSNTITVNERSGTDTIEFVVSSEIPIASGAYKIVVDLLPVGGGWPDRLHEIIIPDISAIMHVDGVSISSCLATDLPKGDSHQLNATVTPNNAYDKSVAWTSLNTSVAIVSVDGLVTAVNDGSAEVIVTTNDGSYTDTCDIIVSTIRVSGVTLNDCPSTELVVGNTHLLNATVAPEDTYDKTITWSSSDNAIATISSSGLIQAMAPGSVKITVTTNDGSFKDSCLINVIPVQVTGVSINNCPTEAINKDSTYLLSATVSPENAADKTINWSSSNTTIASINAEGLIMAMSSGEAMIYVETQNGGFKDSCQIIIEAGNGLESIATKHIPKIYPNPVDNVLNVEFTDNTPKNIQIFDMIGCLLYSADTHEQNIQINVQLFSAHKQLILTVQSEKSFSSYRILVH